MNNSPYLGDRPAEITIENGFVSFNNQLIKTDDTVTYYYPEGTDRETIYRGAEDIAEPVSSTHLDVYKRQTDISINVSATIFSKEFWHQEPACPPSALLPSIWASAPSRWKTLTSS